MLGKAHQLLRVVNLDIKVVLGLSRLLIFDLVNDSLSFREELANQDRLALLLAVFSYRIEGHFCTILSLSVLDQGSDCQAVGGNQVPHLPFRVHHRNVGLHALL